MNARPLIRILISAGLSLVCAFLFMIVGTAVIMRTDDPASAAPAVGYIAFFAGAFLCGVLSGRNAEIHPLPAGLCGGGIFAAAVTLLSFFIQGSVGWTLHLLLALGGVMCALTGSLIFLIKLPKPRKSQARKQFLRSRR